MTVKQISVFLENKPGRLAKFTDILRQNDIDMRAMSIAETPDFGILRIIVDDAYKTACVIKEEGYISSITPVIAIAIPDQTGSLYRVLNILGDNAVNLEYMYAFTSRKDDFAYMILRVSDNEKAIEALSQNHVKLLSQDELCSL